MASSAPYNLIHHSIMNGDPSKFESHLSQWLQTSTATTFAFNTLGTSHKAAKTFPCHEKMKGKDRPYADELKPHWERARKLGLTAQAEAIEKMALQKDILELTQGAGYPEVTDKDLEAMFEFPRLRRKVWRHNFRAGIPFWGRGETITLRLKKDDVERSGVAIPFGAQLRLEEAKEAGIFTSFKVVYPNVVTETQLAAERARERDPALVGEFNGCMFLICSWDLPQDIKKAEADMEALKALKIEG